MSNKKLIESINNIIKSILIEEDIHTYKAMYKNKYDELQRKYVIGTSLKDKTIDAQTFDEIFLSDPTINKTYDELSPYILNQKGVKNKYDIDKNEFEKYIRLTFDIGNDKNIVKDTNGDIDQKFYKQMQDQMIKDNNANETQDISVYNSLKAINKTIDQYSNKILKDKMNENILNTIPITPKDFPIYVEYMLKYYVKDDIIDLDRLKNVFYELFSLVINENKIDNLNLSLGYAKNDDFDTLVQDMNKIKLTKSIDYDLTNKLNSIVKQNHISNDLADQLQNIDPTKVKNLLYFNSIIKWYSELARNKKYNNDEIKLEIKKEVDDFNKQAIELDISEQNIYDILKSMKSFEMFKNYTKKLIKLQKVKNPKYNQENNNENDEENNHELRSIFGLFRAQQWNSLYYYAKNTIQKILNTIRDSAPTIDVRTGDEIERGYPDMNYISLLPQNQGKVFQLKPGGNYFGFLFNLELYSHLNTIGVRKVENDTGIDSIYGIQQLIAKYENNLHIPQNKHKFIYALVYQKLNRDENNKIEISYDIYDYEILVVLLSNDVLKNLIDNKKLNKMTIKEFLNIYGDNRDISRNLKNMYYDIRAFDDDEKKSFRVFNKSNDIGFNRQLANIDQSVIPITNTDYVERKTGDAGYEEQ